jgi:hypothetical protein
MLMNARQRIDATRCPHFAALARRATRHRNAATVNSATDIVGNYKPFAVAESGVRVRVNGVGIEPDDIRVVALYKDTASGCPCTSPCVPRTCPPTHYPQPAHG